MYFFKVNYRYIFFYKEILDVFWNYFIGLNKVVFFFFIVFRLLIVSL